MLAVHQPASCCAAAAVMFAMQPPPKVLPGQAPAAATAEDATPPPPPAAASSSATAAAAGPQPSSPGSSVTPQASAGAPALTGDTGSSGDTSDAQVTPPAPPAANPLILLLDVVLEAPVIVMPLASGSQDHMEVDLGTLEVSNRVMWEVKGQGAARQRLLLDQLQVRWCGGHAGAWLQPCAYAALDLQGGPACLLWHGSEGAASGSRTAVVTSYTSSCLRTMSFSCCSPSYRLLHHFNAWTQLVTTFFAMSSTQQESHVLH